MTAYPLSKTGERRLAEAEATIERGLATFWEVGSALMQIRDERLYRSEFGTFEDYCQQRWNMSRRRANQLVDAAQMGTMVPIENERQARALTPLKEDPAEVREVYAEAERRGDTSSAGLTRVITERHPVPVESPTTAGGGGVPAPDDEPAPPPPVPPVDPAAGYRARATAERSRVRDGLLTLDPARVLETTDAPKEWADLSQDLHRWLDTLDAALAGPRLKAVR